MGAVGQFGLSFLLVAVLISILLNTLAAVKHSERLRRFGRIAMLSQFVFAGIAAFALWWLLITQNWSYAYVSNYTGPGLALIYRVAAFWGGNEGSLLFWALILTFYGFLVSFTRHEDSERMLPWVSLILSCITLFFAIIVKFSANPFIRLPHPQVGSGLNPLLQNPGMTVHPVNVYLGFIGFSVPFAYGLAGLILKKTDATWLRVTRRWTLVSWLFLSIGIVYGAHWSYEELGWGGYWAWDPVENASLLPWLTGTAFLHSAIVQEKRGMLKGWNIILVSLTFLLTLFGTFLTRSGVLWSIHSFANAPLGNAFLTFLCVAFCVALVLIIWRWPSLKADGPFEAVMSKESGFMLNNILFLASTFAVLWGTLFPIISEALSGQRMMVSSPFYNEVNLPLAVCIMLLMGIGPVMAWRHASVKSIVGHALYPLIVSIGLGLAITGLLHYAYHAASWLATCGIIAALFVFLTVVIEFAQALTARRQLTGESWALSFLRLMSRNRRRYGGYVVHAAIAVMAVGIAGSGAFHVDMQESLSPGQTTSNFAGYTATFTGMGVQAKRGGRVMYADLVLSRGGKQLGVIQPSASFFDNGQQPSTNVALYSTPLRDVYVVMLGTTNGNMAVFDFHVNPLVEFIWFGADLFILGAAISLWPESTRRRQHAMVGQSARVAALYEQLAELTYDHRMGKLDELVYAVDRDRLTAEIEATEKAERGAWSHLRAEVDAAWDVARAEVKGAVT